MRQSQPRALPRSGRLRARQLHPDPPVLEDAGRVEGKGPEAALVPDLGRVFYNHLEPDLMGSALGCGLYPQMRFSQPPWRLIFRVLQSPDRDQPSHNEDASKDSRSFRNKIETTYHRFHAVARSSGVMAAVVQSRSM